MRGFRIAGVLAMLLACTFDSAVESGGASNGEGPDTGQPTTSTGPDPSTAASTMSAGSLTTAPESTSTTTEPVTSDDPTRGEESTAPTDGTTTMEDGTTTVTCVAETEVCDGADNDCDEGVDEGSSMNGACNGCTFVLSNDGGSYFAICPDPVTWDEGRTACDAYGPTADLAMIDNDTDQATLIGATAGDHFIGVSEPEEGHWVFVDGTDSIVDGVHQPYDGWAAGQPEGNVAENCGELDPGQLGWADTPCDTPQPYICRHPS